MQQHERFNAIRRKYMTTGHVRLSETSAGHVNLSVWSARLHPAQERLIISANGTYDNANMLATLGRYIRLPPQWLPSDDSATTSGSGRETNSADDDFDWGLDPDESKDEERDQRVQKWIQPIRSAILVRLVEEAFPNEQRWIFYFLMIQFHEDLYAPLSVYSLLPSLFMWYFPYNAYISPTSVYNITRSIDGYMRSKYKTATEMLVPTAVYGVSLLLF